MLITDCFSLSRFSYRLGQSVVPEQVISETFFQHWQIFINHNFFTFNRRTKHKRMQQEDGDSKSGGGNQNSPSHYDDDDELIDMDDCPSDDEWKIVLMDPVIG